MPYIERCRFKMNGNYELTLAVFYCQNVPGSDEGERRILEKKYGKALRLFPLPCSGRLDPVHLLRALEEFADAAYVVACPKGNCRYFEGNSRAGKRVGKTRELIEQIGLEGNRIGLVYGSKENPETLSYQIDKIRDDLSELGPSPVLKIMK